MMRSVVTEGTATAAKVLGPYVAGKTGTSNDARDTWFIGLTADYAIGVWIGYDDPKGMKGETGGHAALPQDTLARLLLPLGEFTAADVQEMAQDFKVNGTV